MCVIIWAPCGKIPKEHVLTAMENHPDGWGFTVVSKNKLRTYRSVDPKEFVAAWLNRADGPVLFHARWATHGEVCRANCHPFPVVGHKLVMAHNGILRGYGSTGLSDTRDFIKRVIEPLPTWFLEEQEIISGLERVADSSKLVFLNNEGTATIINEEFGVWNSGRWYSNYSAF